MQDIYTFKMTAFSFCLLKKARVSDFFGGNLFRISGEILFRISARPHQLTLTYVTFLPQEYPVCEQQRKKNSANSK
jgi:hypothetical protein